MAKTASSIVKVSYPAARTLDRYLRARSRHAQAWRPLQGLGVSNRGPRPRPFVTTPNLTCAPGPHA